MGTTENGGCRPRRLVPGAAVAAVTVLTAVVIAVIGPASGEPHLQAGQRGTAGVPADRTTTTTTTPCNMLARLLTLCGATTTTTTTEPAPPATTTAPLPVASVPPPTTTGSHADTGSPAPDNATPRRPCSNSTPPVAAPSGSWSCTLDDEFNGTSLNTSIWNPVLTSETNYMTGPLLDQACYVDTPQTINESGGTLNLTVVPTPNATCPAMGGATTTTNYQAGMVDSYRLFSQKYGFFEVRAAMPSAAVPGLQETLWLYPENETAYGAWPNSGEIDFGELYSAYPDLDVPADHFPGSGSDPQASSNGCSQAGTATAGQFDTYGVLWTPNTIETFLNGAPCTIDDYGPYVTWPDTAPAPFTQPFFMAFTAALGDNGNSFEAGVTPLPATTKIDWVRVWQYS